MRRIIIDIFLSLIAILFVGIILINLVLSCTEKDVNPIIDGVETNTLFNSINIDYKQYKIKGRNFFIINIDNHLYVTMTGTSDCITHLESCPNKNH